MQKKKKKKKKKTKERERERCKIQLINLKNKKQFKQTYVHVFFFPVCLSINSHFLRSRKVLNNDKPFSFIIIMQGIGKSVGGGEE
jgi:hypothetical protein